MRIDLFLVPVPNIESQLSDKTLVVIDILRASTTICQALKSGARAVIPVMEPGEAAEMRTKIGIETTVLGGERNGLKIEGFDLGNSPLEYTEEKVKGKTIILTTSNGTRVYNRTAASKLILTGALVNISRVVKRTAQAGNDIVIICAGQNGDFSIEDTLCGGMLLHRLATDEKTEMELNDAASLALLLYRSNSRTLKQTISRGEHGRYLTKLGFEADVNMATETDSMPVLPILKDSRIIIEET
ncbi:MAG: 2-phosphosulfolactate phosphatase [candidate division Zixibacteria bacterium]|nr:2-phosphosulfolactate phosphatase [candidate division Zixibacteria bacterium]